MFGYIMLSKLRDMTITCKTPAIPQMNADGFSTCCQTCQTSQKSHMPCLWCRRFSPLPQSSWWSELSLPLTPRSSSWHWRRNWRWNLQMEEEDEKMAWLTAAPYCVTKRNKTWPQHRSTNTSEDSCSHRPSCCQQTPKLKTKRTRLNLL